MTEVQRKEFQAEVQELLGIVIHSLYSNRDVFLRELISNASDALDKRRFLALTDPALQEPNLAIRLIPDAKARTLTVSDNGIGMSEEEVVENIGTIAKSGTRAFLDNLKKAGKEGGLDLIGQFGVGFYASFMVAGEVELVTRKAGSDKAVRWTSNGTGGYTLQAAQRKEPGSDVILHLKPKEEGDESSKDYADPWELRQLVKRYSDFITHPVMLVTEEAGKGKEDTVNSMKALWTRPKSEVKPEEYAEFYKQIAHDSTAPLETIAFSAEGTLEYHALLFIPTRAPFDLMFREGRRGLQLYVKRVFIMGDCDRLLPDWMRFVKGLVDSADLSLNLSREMLQHDRQIDAIRKRLTRKVLDTLKDMKKNEGEKYLRFWHEFGTVLKEGFAQDPAHHEDLRELVLFPTSRSTEPSGLADYVARMKDDQKEIYYILGESLETLKGSPLLEVFRERDLEVLFLADRVDEFAAPALHEYQGRKFRSVSQGEVELPGGAPAKEAKAKEEELQKRHSGLLEALHKALEEDIKEARFSKRLTRSAACLVGAEGDLSPQMEQFMRQLGQAVPKGKRILEINPTHPILGVLEKLHGAGPESPQFQDSARLLYDQALLAEGLPLKDPVEFARKVADLMVAAQR